MGNIRLSCVECGNSFLFSEGEQLYYKRNHLAVPKRCKKCRNASTGISLGVRTSSYFGNATIYGPGVSVEGGLAVEYCYQIENMENKFLVIKENECLFTSNKKEATCFRNRINAEKIVKYLIEEKRVQCKIIANSQYVHIRE